jgi:hypothetical protein
MILLFRLIKNNNANINSKIDLPKLFRIIINNELMNCIFVRKLK